MNASVNFDQFRGRLADFHPRQDAHTRALALYSAAIAAADEEILNRTVELSQEHGVRREQLYEIVLQSHLFLGFPRMLRAAEHLDGRFPSPNAASILQKISAEESETWFANGLDLCRRVYRTNYLPLKQKVEGLAPEAFRWMVIEGYGKVLSRPGLDVINRELAIVACLMIENCEKQLFSHIRGAVNVGAPIGLIRQVVHDLGEAAGDGYAASLSILDRLGMS
jgi:alkylhydroperoxidase/carboxymuconolactone decarboxylase family protein YurZ